MDAVWLTTELRVFGRDGRGGGSDVLVDEGLLAADIVGNADEVAEGIVVLLPVGHQFVIKVSQHVQLLPAVPTLSHGLGGETVLILGVPAVYELSFQLSTSASFIGFCASNAQEVIDVAGRGTVAAQKSGVGRRRNEPRLCAVEVCECILTYCN